jgi:hypothetical protein
VAVRAAATAGTGCGNGRVVELERAGEVQFETAKIMIPELKVEMLA